MIDLPKLISLRGNSGSGKTTIAHLLQSQLKEDTLLICQDIIRKQMLNAQDGPNSPAIDLLIDLVKFGHKHCRIVILEGILRSDWYSPLFQTIQQLYSQQIYAYYFDLPFEETLHRHQQREERNEFGPDKMKRWYKEKDYLKMIDETILAKELTKEKIIERILADINQTI